MVDGTVREADWIHDAVMKNLIGRDVGRWRALVRDRSAKIHLYGKHEARAGRKMGHVTWLKPRRD